MCVTLKYFETINWTGTNLAHKLQQHHQRLCLSTECAPICIHIDSHFAHSVAHLAVLSTPHSWLPINQEKRSTLLSRKINVSFPRSNKKQSMYTKIHRFSQREKKSQRKTLARMNKYSSFGFLLIVNNFVHASVEWNGNGKLIYLTLVLTLFFSIYPICWNRNIDISTLGCCSCCVCSFSVHFSNDVKMVHTHRIFRSERISSKRDSVVGR
jgi:hypothetical protein